jgi:signal peptidase I
MAGLVLRFLVPPGSSADSGEALTWLGRFVDEAPVPFAVALFLLFTSLARYWRAYLPGAQYLQNEAREAGPPREGVRRTALLVVALVLAAAAGLFLRGNVAGSYRVVSNSMLPTLDIGDRIVVGKSAYGLRIPLREGRLGVTPPRRGDVIVFHTQLARGGPTELVKRVIGIPGDLITMAAGRPVINGWPVPMCDAGLFVDLGGGGEPVRGRLAVEFLEGSAHLIVVEPMLERFPGYRVGPDEVFVLGDNRGHSIDSRATNLRGGQGVGIPLDSIQGRVRRILYGTGHDGRLDRGRTWRELAQDVHLPGIDVHDLRAGIEKCLKNPPPSTPPAPVEMSTSEP